MIEIVQRILDNMKYEAPPSAAVIAEARARYQKMLVHVPGDDGDDGYNDGDDGYNDGDNGYNNGNNGYNDGDNGDDGNGAATNSKHRDSKHHVDELDDPLASGQVFTLPPGGSGSIISFLSGSSSGSFSMYSLGGGPQFITRNFHSLPNKIPSKPFPPLPPLPSLLPPPTAGHPGTVSTGIMHRYSSPSGQREDKDEEQSPMKKRRQK